MPTATRAGKRSAGFDHQRRIAHGDRAEDDAARARGQPALDMGERADAAAELDRVLRRLQDCVDGSAVDALAGKGAVEIDDMQPFEALVLEGLRLRAPDRDCRRSPASMSPSFEAHALAVLEVDGGK